MGQIKIKQNLGEGRYTVEIMRDIERSKTRKKQLEDQVKDLEKKTPELKKDYDEALAKELVKRQEAEIKMVELETDTSVIDQLRSDYDSQVFQLESNQTALKSKQNTKDGLQSAIDSGNYTGVDLANLQSQLTAVNSDISDINAQITANQNEIKRIEAAIAELENPVERVKKINELFAGVMAVVLETRKFKLALDYNNLAIEAKKKKIAEYKDINSVIDIRDAWCVDYALDLDNGLENLEQQLDEISGKLGLQKNYKITNQSKLVELQSAGVANDDPQIVAVKEAIKNNQDEIDALTLQKNELLKKEMRVSVDINDENNHILIAPYTYEVVQKDIDEKTVYIQKQIDKKDGYLDEVDKLQGQINTFQTKITDAYADITDTSRLLAYIGGESTEDEYIIARRKNLQDDIDRLRKDIEQYSREITKLTQQQKKWQTKADVLIKRILLLNDELKDLNSAFNKPDKILTPTVTDRTRQFQPVLSSSPEAVYFNKALLPGVQKWMPTYRLGTITAMADGDMCTVELSDAESSQQQLDINQHKILTNVRIKYGSCNSGAFEVGDRVVVEFQNREQDSPTVIGFEDHPRPCGLSVFVRRKDPMTTKLYQTVHSNPGERAQYDSEVRWWYSKDRKKSISWWTAQREHTHSKNVGKNIYIKGVTYGVTPKLTFSEQILACCYANEEQSAAITQAFPSKAGDFIICMIGENKPANPGNIFALDYNSHLTRVVVLLVDKPTKTLVWVDDAYSFSVYEPDNQFSYSDTEWDVFDARFSTDSTTFFYAFRCVYANASKVDRFDITIGVSGLTVDRTEPVLFYDGQFSTGENIVGGGVDDDYYYFVYSKEIFSVLNFVDDPLNVAIINSTTNVFNIFVGKINIKTRQVEYEVQNLYSKLMSGNVSSVFDSRAAESLVTTLQTEALEFVFLYYDGFTKSALFFVSEHNFHLSGNGSKTSGYVENFTLTQHVNLYLFQDNASVLIDKLIPDTTSITTINHLDWLGSDATTLQGSGGVILDNVSSTRNTRDGFFRNAAFYTATKSAAGGWPRDITLRYNLRHWVEFGDSWFIKTSMAENNKMLVYALDIIFVKPGQTVFNYTRRYEKSQAFEITPTGLNESLLESTVNFVSVTG